MTLTDFLLARIAEVEADQREGMQRRYGSNDQWHALGCSLNNMNNDPCDCGIPGRVLARCDADRIIVRLHGQVGGFCTMCGDELNTGLEVSPAPCLTLRALALPYADHPDYREKWQP